MSPGTTYVVRARMPGTDDSEKRLTKARDGSDVAYSVVACADNVSPHATGKSTRIGSSVSINLNNDRLRSVVWSPRPKNGISGRLKCLIATVTWGIRNEPTSYT